MIGGVDDRLGKRCRTLAAALERLVQLGRMRAVLEREPADEVDLLVRVAREPVDGDDGAQPEPGHDLEVAPQVLGAELDRVQPAVGIAAVMLERLGGRDEHDGARAEPARAADDVQELLHAHVRAEARLRDDVVAELQRDEVGDERVVAVRDVRERAAVDERRLTLERLDEVRLERVLEEHGHRAGRPELLCEDRLALEGVRDGDRPSRSRRSCRSRATATIAITSDAAVMSKPDWRG